MAIEDVGELGAPERHDDPFLDRRVRRHIEELPAVSARLSRALPGNLDPSEICKIVGMPVNTVKSHLHRALVALRRKLENH